MKYKVGDKVRVRKDLILGKMYGSNNFTSSMIPLLGRVVTIEKCCIDAYGIEGYIALLTDDMIEGLAEEAQPEEPEKAITLLREMKHNCEHANKYDDPKRHDKSKALGFAIELIEHGCSAVEANYKPEKPEDISHGNTIRPGYYQSSMGDVFDIANAFDLDMEKGTAVKYILRAGKKSPNTHIQDIKKAIRCLEREIEKLERKSN